MQQLVNEFQHLKDQTLRQYIVWGQARRKKVRTGLSCRLHVHLNYLLSYRNKQQQEGKTKNQPTKPKTSASSYDQMEFPHKNHKPQEWHHNASASPDLNKRHGAVIFRNPLYPPLHHLKPELLCSPSRLLELAQMSHTAHLTLSFFTSAFFSGFHKQVQEQSWGKHMEER